MDCNFFYGKGDENHQMYVSIARAIKQTAVIIEAYHFCQLRKHLLNILLSRLTPYAEEMIGDHQCGF